MLLLLVPTCLTHFHTPELELKRIVGAGSFGECFAANYQGDVVAVKRTPPDKVSEETVSDMTEEVLLLCEVRHANIVQYIGCCFQPQVCIVVSCTAPMAPPSRQLADTLFRWSI